MNEPLDESAAGGTALFDEKSFYLEAFYGKSLLFALTPPSGERLGELNSLVRTLRELRRHQARCIVIVSADALWRMMRRLGRLAPRTEPPVFNPSAGLRSRPYPPDSAVARIWRALSAGSIVVGAADTNKPTDFTVFAQELASRLRVFKLILLDRQGGLTGRDGERLSFVELGRISRAVRKERSARRRAALRAVARALGDGVGSVNLAAPRDVYEELFSFIGAGTLFTERQYGFVRPISIDDFEEVAVGKLIQLPLAVGLHDLGYRHAGVPQGGDDLVPRPVCTPRRQPLINEIFVRTATGHRRQDRIGCPGG